MNIGVSWSRKTNIFFIFLQKTNVDQNCYIALLKTSLLLECRRHYLGDDFEFLQDSASSRRAKVMQQFLRQNTPDFIAADEWASYSPDLDLGYPAGFGVRRLTTSVCKSVGREKKRQSKQMEGGHHWDSSKIHSTMQKRLNAVWKQNGGAIQHILLIAVTGYRSFAYFTVKTKAYNVIISNIYFIKMLFPFVWILLLSSTTYCKVWDFFNDPPSMCTASGSDQSTP